MFHALIAIGPFRSTYLVRFRLGAAPHSAPFGPRAGKQLKLA